MTRDELQALSDAATPGPWEARDFGVWYRTLGVIANGASTGPDAAFIVALVNAFRADEIAPVAELEAMTRYAEALARGLSDYEAREEGWPS